MKGKWKIIKKKKIFTHPYMVLERWQMQVPSGKVIEIMMGGGPYDFVMVGAQTASGKMVVLNQYYISQRRKIPTIVAGIIDQSESPLVTARRELLEETGYAASAG